MMTQAEPLHRERIRIRGQVQGVGFRPQVWQLAQQFNIAGEVHNDGSGVQIIAQSSERNIARMLQRLQQQPPPLARIDSIEREVIDDAPRYERFSISHSVASEIQTAIVADAASCDACVAEINDADNRRHAYAFTNCTHCGPRLSIIHQLPYDRANTSMAPFTLCDACRAEYENPQDRRFHAQPNACPDCGPQLQWRDAQGAVLARGDVIARAAAEIRAGGIVAIKGTGGFQLACDAANEQAVARLRTRKRRPHKALALMAASIEQIEQYAKLDALAILQLQSSAAPIVLLDARADGRALARSISPALRSFGFMLPNSPLHHLLLQHLDTPIVLTSGNAANRVQCIDNDEALQQLGGIADGFLLHDRAIVNRLDDSVLRIMAGRTHIYRRARGFAPQPLALPPGLSRRSIIACGSEMKSTFCLARDGAATLSQHIGNLDNMQTFDDYLQQLDLYQQLYRFKAAAIAVDLHPEYQAGKFGRQWAAQQGLPLIEVQHHHAHIAACLADNGWQQGRVIGIALDGLGYGEDATLWGGEFLYADYAGFERYARFKPVPMAGGYLASLEPWRNLVAQLYRHCDWTAMRKQYAALPLFEYLAEKPLAAIENMMRNGLNAPLTSSCGRLFDAVACALGICPQRQSYEGQAAIELENLLDPVDMERRQAYPFALEHQSALLEINPAPMWQALLQDLSAQVSAAQIAASFHLGLAQVVVAVAQRMRDGSGINQVALSGGVFQNRHLLESCVQMFQAQGFDVLQHQSVPANDGGLALGQAAVAAAKIQREKTSCV